MKARTLLALSLVAIAIGILFAPLSLFAAPPLPDGAGAPLRLDARDVLNPEFPAVPAEDLHPMPEPAVAFDDALARTIVWAGAPGVSTNAPAEEPGLAERLWPDGIDWARTAKWVSGIGATIFGGWWAAERADFWENEVDSGPVPSPAETAARQQAADQLAAGQGVPGEVVNLVISGVFLGPVQVLDGRQFTPGLTFLQGPPGRAGEVTAYLASDGTNRQGGGTWRATYGNEIALAIPDGAYAGLARIQGANIVLASGIVLRPQAGASISVSQP